MFIISGISRDVMCKTCAIPQCDSDDWKDT